MLERTKLYRAAGMLALAVAAGYAVWAASGALASNMDAGAAERLEDAVRQAAVACYSTEGMYPDRLEYLVENYGLRPDPAFTVKYGVFASNLPPEIVVIARQEGAGDGK